MNDSMLSEDGKREEKHNNNNNSYDHDEIISLRRKLDRRSCLFDLLQKAYHRDVIAVKEALFRSTVTTDTNSTDTNRKEERKLADLRQLLQTVPSTDIRPLVASFDLFAPAECELRCKPCNHCGGTLEIVHKECNVFEMLNQQLNDLQIRADRLQQELISTKDQALQERLDFVNRERKASDIHLEMEKRIAELQGEITANEDLVRRAQSFEEARHNMEKTMVNWENRCHLEEEAKAIGTEKHQLHLTMLQREKEEMSNQLQKIETDLAREILINKKLIKELELSKEEIAELVETNDLLRSQIYQENIESEKEMEENQRLQYRITQMQQNEELLRQKASRLESYQKEVLDLAEVKSEKLQQEMKLLQKDSTNERALQKRHFLGQIREISQRHKEELESKNEEIKFCNKEAREKQQEWSAILESIVTATKILTDGCIQQRQLLQREGWYELDSMIVATHEETSIVSLDIFERKKILKKLEDKIFGIIDDVLPCRALDNISAIQWEVLLTSKGGRKDVLDFLQLVMTKNVWLTAGLVDSLHHDAEMRVKELQETVETERLMFQKSLSLQSEELVALKGENSQLSEQRQREAFSLAQRLQALEQEYDVLLYKSKEEKTNAMTMELQVIESKAALEDRDRDMSMANEQICGYVKEIERMNQEKEVYRMSCSDRDANYLRLCNTLFHIHQKELNRLQTNISLGTQSVCSTKEAEVQVDLLSSLPLTLNPYFTSCSINSDGVKAESFPIPLAYYTTPSLLHRSFHEP